MTDKLIVTGYGAGEGLDTQVRFNVGPESDKRPGQVAFGMGAEVIGRWGWDFDKDHERIVDVTISQGGIGGQDIETAEIRAAAFMLAVQVAKRTADRIEGGMVGENLAKLEVGTYPLNGRYVYSKDSR